MCFSYFLQLEKNIRRRRRKEETLQPVKRKPQHFEEKKTFTSRKLNM